MFQGDHTFMKTKYLAPVSILFLFTLTASQCGSKKWLEWLDQTHVTIKPNPVVVRGSNIKFDLTLRAPKKLFVKTDSAYIEIHVDYWPNDKDELLRSCKLKSIHGEGPVNETFTIDKLIQLDQDSSQLTIRFVLFKKGAEQESPQVAVGRIIRK